MRENQDAIIQFSKIVERYPEIYDTRLDAYKTRLADTAWENVAASVRNELKEECTVEELKMKWKGIRSSFNRYKNKLQSQSDSSSCKKYYLYDTLKFLEPFTRPKGLQIKENRSEDCSIYDDTSKEIHESTSVAHWKVQDIKPDVTCKEQDPLVHPRLSSVFTSEYSFCDNAKKRKYSSEDKAIDDENEDLQFFKSILPDIRNFSNKEKRKLKMGILKLIDDLENERKQI